MKNITDDIEETRQRWERHADGWQQQVGATGDSNRLLNSDPVLLELLGDVVGLWILDAGCGTGYLTNHLRDRGAHVIGVDLAERMIAIAREQYPGIDFRVDSCTTLATVGDAQFDRVVANYVLMDTPDLDATIHAFHRVLRPGGHAVVVFSHPCFPQGAAAIGSSGDIIYRWDFSYFEPQKRIDPPWAHFTDDFIWFHRPLSDYWKAFHIHGFSVVAFEEPRLAPDRAHLAPSPRKLRDSMTRPYSVAFKLLKR